jgi:hypothetical protein
MLQTYNQIFMKNYTFAALIVFAVSFLYSCSNDKNQKGCTDMMALNYNPKAKINDGSCRYGNINFNPTGHGHTDITGGGGGGNTNPSIGTLNVPQKNMGLIILKTALWCGPCGSQGHPTFVQVYTENKDKAVSMKVNSSDALSVSYIDNAMSSNFGISGIPNFVAVNNFDAWPASTINSEVNQHFSNDVVISNGSARARFVGDKVEIDGRARFFKDVSGDYFMAIYLLEDGVIAEQSGYTGDNAPMATHNNLVRASASLNAFGEKISLQGVTPEATVVNKSYVIDFDVDNWKRENLKIATVIWKFDETDSKYKFVNGSW